MKSNHEKQLLLDLHNDDRAKVYFLSDFFIKFATFLLIMYLLPHFVRLQKVVLALEKLAICKRFHGVMI